MLYRSDGLDDHTYCELLFDSPANVVNDEGLQL